MSAQPSCAVCGVRADFARAWWWRCPSCGHRMARLDVAFESAADNLDDVGLKEALTAQRQRELSALLDRLAVVRPVRRLLDVGSSTGDFLELCAARGIEAVGVEPDPRVAEVARARGFQVVRGTFPDGAPTSAKFDVVTFNDTLEHIPAVEAALIGARTRLAEGGRVAVTLPSREGFFFRAAEGLAAVGIAAPLERLWQVGFPSPHLHYFAPDGLAQVARRAGLVEVERVARPAVEDENLWSRIRADRQRGPWMAVPVFLAVRAALPILGHLPGDISVQVFEIG